MTNAEKAQRTYEELQKRKMNKAKNNQIEFNCYKTAVCAKARKRTYIYR